MKNEFYKRPGEECEYTPEMIQELKKCKNDPIYFINKYVYIQNPEFGKILFNTHPYQDRMIRCFQSNDWAIAKAGRQLGKSTVIAAYILWFGIFHSDKNVLVASNKNANAMDIMSRIIFAYEELPMWLKPGVRYATKHSLEFDNGSKIMSQATTENTGRGMSISLLMLDELAFVNKRIQEDMWTSLAPTLSNGGRCIISSTPNGDSDLFAQLWTGAELGTNGFSFINVEWDEHPARDESFKTNMIQKVGELKWRQEYCCEFLSSDPLLISSIALQNMRPNKPINTDHGFAFWDKFYCNRTYFLGVDVSSGTGADYSTIQIFDFPAMNQVAEFRSNKVNTPQLYALIKWVINYINKTAIAHNAHEDYPEIIWTFENNGIGEGLVALYYNDESFPDNAIFESDSSKRPGYATTGTSKIQACMDLKGLVERKEGGFNINSGVLQTELKNYIAKGKSYEAKYGATDDLVAALLIVTRLFKRFSEYDEDAFAIVNEYYTEEDMDEWDMPLPFCG